MASDLTDFGSLDDLIPIERVPKILPGNPNISTIHRWRTKGVLGIRLHSVRVGGRRMIPRESLIAFISAITAAVDGDRVAVVTRPGRSRSIEAAEREVDSRLVATRRGNAGNRLARQSQATTSSRSNVVRRRTQS